jgi:hypothetical protein
MRLLYEKRVVLSNRKVHTSWAYFLGIFHARAILFSQHFFLILLIAAVSTEKRNVKFNGGFGGKLIEVTVVTLTRKSANGRDGWPHDRDLNGNLQRCRQVI